MGVPLLDPIRDLLRARAGAAGILVVTGTATVLLAALAIAMLVAGGVVALAQVIGFPVAAVLSAALFALLALAMHLVGQTILARRKVRLAAMQRRAESDLALAMTLARSTRPLLPIAAFIAAFVLARRS